MRLPGLHSVRRLSSADARRCRLLLLPPARALFSFPPHGPFPPMVPITAAPRLQSRTPISTLATSPPSVLAGEQLAGSRAPRVIGTCAIVHAMLVARRWSDRRFLYFNDVDEGGETEFNLLNITVRPRRGRLLLWPNVLDARPDLVDRRTDHEARPVLAGQKHAVNSWVRFGCILLCLHGLGGCSSLGGYSLLACLRRGRRSRHPSPPRSVRRPPYPCRARGCMMPGLCMHAARRSAFSIIFRSSCDDARD